MDATVTELKPKTRKYVERIGGRDWDLEEVELDVYDDVTLWSENPRLQNLLAPSGLKSELQLEAALQNSRGYDTLLKSIEDIGQMEPVYVQRFDDMSKALVLEGATRLTIFRQLDRKFTKGIKEGKFRRIRAKLLPPEFGERERTILLARIHVRGTGVRDWGRYIEARFIHEAVVGTATSGALMNVSEMAQHMEKSVSWVQRLRDAYTFAHAYVVHVDEDEGMGEKIAAEKFSVLEEISKARVIGSQLREYDNPNFDSLRADVFDMVRNEAFKEYRDARFLKEFYDDPEKWDQLKSGEKHVAGRLALEIKSNSSSVKAKIASIGQQVVRSLDRDEGDLGEDEIKLLNQAAAQIEQHLMPGVRPFRVSLRKFTISLTEVSMADVKALDPSDVEEFREALEYFDQLYLKHGKAT
ncbi:hypothetical protein [Mesorhizobium sp. BE184]|uniref:hypothetical protein n=1 Tax=Mesorhizobium sp. BE184 TaxID=2817714 RepID=UPI002865A8D0|nr:hypothetical protein [Mesorhizobium sp. BE184]MDR7033258.1 hypothetical protein [Mesorhizobium sp. BE184]